MSPLLFQVLGWITATCCLIGALAAILLIIAHYWYKYHPDIDEPVDIFYENLTATISYQIDDKAYLCTCPEIKTATYFYNVDEEEAIELGQKWLKQLSENS